MHGRFKTINQRFFSPNATAFKRFTVVPVHWDYTVVIRCPFSDNPMAFFFQDDPFSFSRDHRTISTAQTNASKDPSSSSLFVKEKRTPIFQTTHGLFKPNPLPSVRQLSLDETDTMPKMDFLHFEI